MRSRDLALISGVLVLGPATACTSTPAADPTPSIAPVAGTSTSADTGSSAMPTSAVPTTAPPSGEALVRPTEIPGLDASVLEVMNKAPYDAGQWAVSVSDLETGEKLVSYNDALLFQPGSVVKTYSMGAAWQEFEPDHQIVTPVKRTGEVGGERTPGQGEL